MHCGSREHDLASCPNISDEQLAKNFIQLQDTELDDEDLVSAAVLIQPQRIGDAKDTRLTGGLRSSRLYLDTCTTNNQCTNSAYLQDIHTVAKPLTMHTMRAHP